VRIGILGPLEVRDEAGQLVQLGGPRLRALLIRLALDPGRAVAADRLAGDLWPGDGPGQAGPADSGNALQALVSRLRHAAGPGIVEHRAGGYRLAVDPDDVDAARFERLVAEGRTALAAGDPCPGAALLREALGLWRGPALVDVEDAAFAAGPVARLEELRLAATEDRIEADLALGRGAELAPEAEELATAHPLRERLRGQLMRVLYLAGRQGDALTVYEDTRQLLADRLGVDPSPALSAVHLAILRADPALGQPSSNEADPALRPPSSNRPAPAPGQPSNGATPALSTLPSPGGRDLPARTSNLPAQLTSFVGRDEELNRVSKLLGESRLVILTGPGGTGKTRLAIEAVARLADEMPDGIWFVPLAPVGDALDVPQAVLSAIGAPEAVWMADGDPVRAVLPPLDRLAEILAAQQLVLVLDNCEHLIGAVARLAGRVLGEAPGVRILATSREPLGVTGETLCPVPSLPLPPDGATPAEALEYGSVRLLAERAAAVRPGFTVDEVSVEPAVRICRALDGNPLAIELAAARVRSLTPGQVASRLDDRFSLLTAGSRTALPRHQTLRAIVDWSWDLLDDAERTVLRRLSVFSGGATPAAAEPVCGPGGDPDGLIDVIASLVDKSLVTATGEAEVRYRLLETVRAYAADRLAEAGEEEQVRAAHARYFLDLAEQGEPKLRSADQLAWLARLSAEHDNFAAALRYVIGARDSQAGLRFIAALSWFWVMRDYEAEAGEWAGAVRDITDGPVPPDLGDAYAICHIVSAMTAASQAEDAPATLLLDTLGTAAAVAGPNPGHPLLVLAQPLLAFFAGERDRALAELGALADHRDPWVRAARHALTGHLVLNYGQIDDAGAHLTQGHAEFQAIGDRWGIILCLAGLGEVEMARGRPEEALRILAEARGLAGSGLHGNYSDMMLISMGRARARTGDLDGAREDLERGVRIAERIGEHDDGARGYLALAELARQTGDLDQARHLVERAREITEPKMRLPGMGLLAMTAYSKLGCLSEQQGDLAAAARWHAQAIGMAASSAEVFLPSHPSLAEVVEGLAALAAAQGQPVRAAELLGLAHALHGFRDEASLEVSRTTATVTSAIGTGAFDEAYRRGRRLTRSDALALVP
jgi:predicted ATPase/DNA-binding SARP family transcriptional activator